MRTIRTFSFRTRPPYNKPRLLEGDMDYSEEARLALEEVRYAIREGWLSEKLEKSFLCAHLNLTTSEGDRFCVRLSSRGFQVVGRAYDEVSEEEEEEAWETVYSLLNHISPSYSSSFSQKLANQLSRLQQQEEEEETTNSTN